MRLNPFAKKRTISDVAKPLSPEALKRLTRIVVIDDEPDSVPTDDLRANGYSVEYWPLIDAARLARLERGEFDIVILDIQGIVSPGFSDTGDGLGVLRRLKKANPSQTIIACSGQSYRIDAMDFYRNADATLAKPISAIRAMETLDGVMQTRIGVGTYWEAIATLLKAGGVAESRITELEGEIAEAMTKGSGVSRDRIEHIIGHVGTIATIVELVGKVILLASGG